MDAVKGSRPTRREKAAATRLRMIRAAHEVFCERGYGGATMTEIASRAGVAVQTLYFTFHTKPELLQACYAWAVMGEVDPLVPEEQWWYGPVLNAPDPREAVLAFCQGNAEIAGRAAILDDTMRSAAHEPEARSVRQHSEQLRRDGFAGVIESWQSRFGLRDGLEPERATDVLLALVSGTLFRTMVIETGWSVEEYIAWQVTLILEQVLAS